MIVVHVRRRKTNLFGLCQTGRVQYFHKPPKWAVSIDHIMSIMDKHALIG